MKFKLGGQAVVEGVTIRSENHVVTSIRTPEGKIKTRKRVAPQKYKKSKITSLPVIRGVFNLYDFMKISIQEMTWSANQSVEEEDEKISKKDMAFTLIFSTAVALLFFVYLPWLVANLLTNYFEISYVMLNLIDSIIKIIILAIYLILLGRASDVKTMYCYHGAEHKAINSYEKNKVPSLKNTKKESRIHRRCGTTFIIVIFIMSLLIYTLIPETFSFGLNIMVRIILIPVIAGIAYEVIILTSRYQNIFTDVIISPGLFFQKLTTKEPDDGQMKVALSAVKTAHGLESQLSRKKA